MRKKDAPPALPAFSGPKTSFLRELWLFVRATRKWWLIPVLCALLLLGLVVALSTSWFAPFLYTLF
jgi:hypothetical protein